VTVSPHRDLGRLFKAYDVRGVVPDELDEDLARSIGAAFAEWSGVEAVAIAPRKTYRAHAEGKDVDYALDLVAERLERQIRDHHERRRARRNAGAGRVKSAQTPGGSDEREARSAG